MARITKPVEERRQEIVDTARRLFFESGFDKTQVADISKEMNVAQGLIYHYFKSKTEILYAVIDEFSEEHVQAMQKALSEIEGTAIDYLSMLFMRMPEKQNFVKLFESIMSDQGIIEYCSKKMTVSTLPLLLMLIERGNADGSWQCEFPEETAAFILYGISGIHKLATPNQDEQHKKDAFASIFLKVLGVRAHNETSGQ